MPLEKIARHSMATLIRFAEQGVIEGNKTADGLAKVDTKANSIEFI